MLYNTSYKPGATLKRHTFSLKHDVCTNSSKAQKGLRTCTCVTWHVISTAMCKHVVLPMSHCQKEQVRLDSVYTRKWYKNDLHGVNGHVKLVWSWKDSLGFATVYRAPRTKRSTKMIGRGHWWQSVVASAETIQSHFNSYSCIFACWYFKICLCVCKYICIYVIFI